MLSQNQDYEQEKISGMLAALFYGPNDLRIQEIAIPVGDEKSFLVKINTCAICGYDARVYRNGHRKVTRPVILGHEICAELIQPVRFPNGETISSGTRVAVLPTIPCLNCAYCYAKDYNLCINLKELGSSVNGGFAEYMQIPEQIIKIGGIVPVPENLSNEEASLLEPLACCLNGFSKFRGLGNAPQTNKTLAIIGDGPIGLLHLQLAKNLYNVRTILIGKTNSRMSVARSIGAEVVLDNNEGEADIVQLILHLTDRAGVDYIVIAASDPLTICLAMKIAAKNSQISLFAGFPSGCVAPIDCNWVHYNQISFFGSFSSTPQTFRHASLLAADGQIDLARIITHKYSIKDLEMAIVATEKYQGLRGVVNKF